MLRPRIIACLLVHDGALAKTVNFKDPKYVGDPINAVRIFNEKSADELMVIDINASVRGIRPNFDLIRKLAEECRMPFCYGGGVASVEDAVRLVDLGVEKVAVSSAAVARPGLIFDIAEAIGKQSVVGVLDIVRSAAPIQRYSVSVLNNSKILDIDPLVLAHRFEEEGAGEILFNSVSNDGVMKGYDLEFAELVTPQLNVPTTFIGGAGSSQHIHDLFSRVGVVGAAAGSFFVFKGRFRAVLISYPSLEKKAEICRF